MTDKQFIVNENYIVWGFRYALGRRTSAVEDVCSVLKQYWDDLELSTQKQIQREIREAIRLKHAGMECDVRDWEEILGLPIIVV